jgi:hypothetical protein
MWSLAYRCNPIQDVHVEPYRSSGHAPKSGPRMMDSTLLIDDAEYPMAPLALLAKEFMERAEALWQELELPTLNIRSRWFGYSLGDWTEARDGFAQNAVNGAWEKNGETTWGDGAAASNWKRRRGQSRPVPSTTVDSGS